MILTRRIIPVRGGFVGGFIGRVINALGGKGSGFSTIFPHPRRRPFGLAYQRMNGGLWVPAILHVPGLKRPKREVTMSPKHISKSASRANRAARSIIESLEGRAMFNAVVADFNGDGLVSGDDFAFLDTN